MAETTGVEVAWRGADLLGEGPVWDERSQVLHRVDTASGSVLTLDAGLSVQRAYAVGGPVGCVALRDDGAGLLLGLAAGVGGLDLGTGDVALLAAVPHERPDLQLNDGACDPAGRFLVGSVPPDAAPGHGVLWAYEPPGGARPVLSGIGVSNGLAWDASGATLFHVDSLLRRVDRFRYDAADGAVAERRVAFDLSGYEGIPDGVALDAEGALWVAFWRGGAVRRFDEDGALLAEVHLPVRRTTSCCLGGPDLTTLFVTTARRGLRPSDLPPEPLGGAVFAVEVGTPGLPTPRWSR